MRLDGIFISMFLFYNNHLLTVMSHQLRRVCYHTNWSQYRQGAGKFMPNNIPGHLCTHLIYSFATMEGNQLKPFEWNDETQPWSKGLYDQFNDVKLTNPNLKTLLAVGGWNFGVAKMTSMLHDSSTRSEFVRTSIEYLRKRKFDGLDLDFEYPADRGSPPEDKSKFAQLVVELRHGFDNEGRETGKPPLLLTAAVAAGKSKIDNGYDVPTIARALDFINIMTYDFHGKWEDTTGHNSPLYGHSLEKDTASTLNLAFAAKYWAKLGAPREKLNIGLALYGRSFTLQNSADFGVGSPTKGGGKAGMFTQEEGYQAFYEVCDFVARGANVLWIEEQQVPFAVLGDQWVSFDDDHSLRLKVKWAIENGFGGVMVWALDLDDFSGRCGSGSFPLLRAINEELGVSINQPPKSASVAARYSSETRATDGGYGSSHVTANTVPLLLPSQSRPASRSDHPYSGKHTSSVKKIKHQKGYSSSLQRSQSTLPETTTAVSRSINSVNELYTGSLQPKTSKTRRQMSDKFCQVNLDGYYIDVTTGCTRYIECIDGETRHLACPGGTYFNTDLNACMLYDERTQPTCKQ